MPGLYPIAGVREPWRCVHLTRKWTHAYVPLGHQLVGHSPDRVELLQGGLALIILKTLATVRPQQAYGLAELREQLAQHALSLNQGALCPALVRLEHRGWTGGTLGETERNLDAMFYAIAKGSFRALDQHAGLWR